MNPLNSRRYADLIDRLYPVPSLLKRYLELRVEEMEKTKENNEKNNNIQ